MKAKLLCLLILQQTGAPCFSEKCVDNPHWTSLQGHNCSFYSTSKEHQARCMDGYNFELNTYATAECCACNYVDILSLSPAIDHLNGCLNIEGWLYKNQTCAYYEFLYKEYLPLALQGDVVDDFCFTHSQEVGTHGLAMTEACCFCNGGSFDKDKSNMVPSAPPTQTGLLVKDYYQDCRDIEVEGIDCAASNIMEHCEMPWETVAGHSIRTACCACGYKMDYLQGGLDLSNGILMKEKSVRERYFGAGSMTRSCIDLKTWNSYGIICEAFIASSLEEEHTGTVSQFCQAYGHREDKYSINATRACCACEGGYEGSLIGKTLRVGFAKTLTRPYFLDETDYVDNYLYNGSAVDLMLNIAEYGGFGIYEVKLPGNTLFERELSCLQAVKQNLVDVCIGHFWHTPYTIRSGVPAASLFDDKFYLIVPVEDRSAFTSLWSIFLPFTAGAWLLILVVCFCMSLALICVQGEDAVDGEQFGSSSWKIPFSAGYFALRNLATGDVMNATDNPRLPERILHVGILIFGVVIITGFTGTLAAAIGIQSREQVGISSIHDLVAQNVSFCVNSMITDILTNTFPELNGLQRPQHKIDYDILLDFDNCPVSVVSSSAWDFAALPHKLCASRRLLTNQILLDLGISFVLSYNLAEEVWGQELLTLINSFATNNFFTELRQRNYHDYLAKQLQSTSKHENRNRSLKTGAKNAGNSLVLQGQKGITCTSGEGGSSSSVFQLRVFDLAGLSFLCLVSIIVALTVYACGKIASSKRKSNSVEVGDHGRQTTSSEEGESLVG